MLSTYRPVIHQYLTSFFEDQQQQLGSTPWAQDVTARYASFAPAGKLLRGSLVLAMYEILTGEKPDGLLPAAASVEMMQSSLLIHDDIIDRDQVRRGKPSLYKQYQTLADESNYSSAEHVGISLALCAGDIGFFWGFQLMNQLKLTQEVKQKVLDFFAHEYMIVGLGEMLDVHQTATQKTVTEKDILTLYRFKTARYTFCLPMGLAAQAAGADESVLKTVDALGETMGLLFQIKDDELGLFGSEAETGKPVISDVREGKKTLYYHYLFQLASESVQQRAKQLFGKPDLSLTELEEVRTAVKKSGTKKLVDSYLEKYEKQAKALISALPIELEKQKVLAAFVDESLLRKK